MLIKRVLGLACERGPIKTEKIKINIKILYFGCLDCRAALSNALNNKKNKTGKVAFTFLEAHLKRLLKAKMYLSLSCFIWSKGNHIIEPQP